MTTALQTTTDHGVMTSAPSATLVPARPGLTRDQIDLIKRTICKGATDDELKLFVNTADRLGLDPFARQICFVKRKNRKTGVDDASIQVQIDGLRLVAERTGCYVPGRRSEFEYDNKGRLLCAVAYVQKFSHGSWHEVPEEATWVEFAQDTPPWSRMPRVMLSKVAEARALRRAFPKELGGVYAPEELGGQLEAAAPVDAAALVRDIEAAETLKDLAALVVTLDRVPKQGKSYQLLREAFAKRKVVLEGKEMREDMVRGVDLTRAAPEKVGPEELVPEDERGDPPPPDVDSDEIPFG
jgi:phage recombination protein Bet